MSLRRLALAGLAAVTLSFAGTAGAATGTLPTLTGPVLYGGSSWEVAPVDVPPTLDFVVSCWTAAHCLASDDSDAAAGSPNIAVFLTTTNGGVTWTPVSSFNDGINDFSCFGTKDCLTAPFSGDAHLLLTTNGGTSWTTIGQPPFSVSTLTPQSVACARAFCIVIGSDKAQEIPPGAVAAEVTTDLGKTWKPVTLPPHMSVVQALSCAPSGRCYLVYDTNTHKFSNMATTTDRGRTWQSVTKAPGFTSLDGFSCPSAQSCVYLANQVLEVTTDGARTWHAMYGPFAPKHAASISAFALACVSVTQCLIGGNGGSGTGQTLVWMEAPPWTTKQVKQTLVTLDADSTKTLLDDGNALNGVTNAAAVTAFNNLVGAVRNSGAAIDVLVLHARGKQQKQIVAIGHAWNALSVTLTQTVNDLNAGKSDATDGTEISAQVEAVLQAEKDAGGIGTAPGIKS